MAKNEGKVTAYIDAFLRHSGGANAWVLLLDSDGKALSEVVRRIDLPGMSMRSARIDAVRIALDTAFKAGVRDVEVLLPDPSLASALEYRKPVEAALFPQFLSIMALKHAFRSISFKPGTIDTLSTLSLSLA